MFSFIVTGFILLTSCNSTNNQTAINIQDSKTNIIPTSRIDLRNIENTKLGAQALSLVDRAMISQETQYILENNLSVEAILTTGEIIGYENRGGYAITDEDVILGESSEIGDK